MGTTKTAGAITGSTATTAEAKKAKVMGRGRGENARVYQGIRGRAGFPSGRGAIPQPGVNPFARGRGSYMPCYRGAPFPVRDVWYEGSRNAGHDASTDGTNVPRLSTSSTNAPYWIQQPPSLSSIWSPWSTSRNVRTWWTSPSLQPKTSHAWLSASPWRRSPCWTRTRIEDSALRFNHSILVINLFLWGFKK